MGAFFFCCAEGATVEGRKWNSILSGCLASPTPFHYSLPCLNSHLPCCTVRLCWNEGLPWQAYPPLVQTMLCAIVFLPLFGMSFSSHTPTIYTSPNFKGVGCCVPCHYRRFPIGGSSLLTLIQFPSPIFFVFCLPRIRRASFCYISVIKLWVKATVTIICNDFGCGDIRKFLLLCWCSAQSTASAGSLPECNIYA